MILVLSMSFGYMSAPAVALSSPAPAVPATFTPAGMASPAPALPGFRDSGPLSGSQPVLVAITIPLRNQQLLYSIAMEVSTPGSPDYGRFLTEGQAASLFYPTSEFDSVDSYLTAHGFRVELAALDSAIVAVGTASQVEEYLGLSVDLYSNGTLSYYAASGAPSLPGVYVYASNVTAVLLHSPPTLVAQGALSGLAASAEPNQTSPIEGIPAVDLRSAYNETGLISSGYDGAGRTIGILDLYGDPYIAQQLRAFDAEFGIPNPPNFTVVPIGPYDPNLGILTGWADEISGDVELAHAMAPGANVTLYAANGALPLGSIIAYIVQQHAVDDLSQSFGTPESYTPALGPSYLVANVISADQYYALGSAEGITFIASSGDAGGSGYSAGPLGGAIYPSTSPFVTAAGGTAVYESGNSSVQTAWSNYGFVPFLANYGGSTGGVSDLEPLPWYQSNLSVPQTYPYGRMVPDVSLSASPYPGTWYVAPGNYTGLFAGTSEASPLLAGMLAAVMQYAGRPLGNINPFLYGEGYSTGSVDPVSFGYSIPWVAGPGYNLVAGLGTPDAGNMASALRSIAPRPSLNVTVQAYNSSMEVPENDEFLPGQEITVVANVTEDGSAVTAGNFSADLVTLQGVTAPAELAYNYSLGAWTGTLAVPANASGISYVDVSGTSGGAAGAGMTEVYSGYVMHVLWPPPIYPESAQFGIPVYAAVTDLAGDRITGGAFSLVPEAYNISDNAYSPEAPVSLAYNSTYGLWTGNMSGSYPYGPMVLVARGAYGYTPFVQGADLQGSLILPQVLAEPGSVAPGQSVFIYAYVIPPLNTPSVTGLSTGASVYQDAMYGSNVTAVLVGPNGSVVEAVDVPASPVAPGQYAAAVRVPARAMPGLYTVILGSSYNSTTLGEWINGSFFGQIYVAPSQSTPAISTVRQSYEGQTLTIFANITYANGTEVRYGMYTASAYSSDLQSEYGQLAFFGIPLRYDPSLNAWTGSVRLPSPYAPFAYNLSTGTVGVGPQGYSGPYDVFVSGLSWDGVPTNASLSSQRALYVSPLVFMEGVNESQPAQTSGLALLGSRLSFAGASPVSLSDDAFLGNDTVSGGSPTISYSTVNGTLYIEGSNAVLRYVEGGSVVAVDSNVTLIGSRLSNVTLIGSRLSMGSPPSEVSSLTPALPSIAIISPSQDVPYSGVVPVDVNVTGQGISSVSILVDGSPVYTVDHGGAVEYQLNASSYPDGTHSLVVQVAQSDGMSADAQIQFETTAQLAALRNDAYGILGVALIALVIALALMARSRRWYPADPSARS